MKLTDLLIIYFTVGAPVGVYSYFQIRSEPNQNNHLLKTVFTFFFWLPAVFKLVREQPTVENFISRFESRKLFAGADDAAKLFAIQKRLEIISQGGVSIFSFRETLERYAGLTIAAGNQSSKTSVAGKNFFEISENKNVETAAKCLDRRNRKRLFFHQSSARKDFLEIVENVFAAVSNQREFGELALEFTDLLKDGQARIELENFLAENLLETDLWKPQPRKSLNVTLISQTLKTATPTSRSPKKD